MPRPCGCGLTKKERIMNMKNLFIVGALAFTSVGVAQDSSGRSDLLPAELKAGIIAKFDLDKDGKLNSEERAAAKAAFIKKFDRDGDGTLRTEIRARLKRALMVRFDRNGDGKLDAEERQQIKRAFNERVSASK